MNEMTPWFDKYTRPHWIGVYETRVNELDDTMAYNFWNGSFWEMPTIYPERKWWLKMMASGVQHIEWRGFTSEQK